MICLSFRTTGGTLTTQLLPTSTLATVLRLEQKTFFRWHRSGKLTPDDTTGRPYAYALETIDEFLGRYARASAEDTCPTAIQLFNREDRLLTTAEVAALLGISHNGVNWLAAEGKLAYFTLSASDYRYSARSVARLVSRSAEVIPQITAAQILGIKPHGVMLLTRAGNLERARVAGKGSASYVTRESFVPYLKGRLAESGIPLRIWWEDQLRYPGKMMTPDSLAVWLRMTRKTAVALLEEGRLPYILSPGGNKCVPVRYAQPIADERLPLSPAQIAQTLAVDEHTAEVWMATKALCNGRHTRSSTYCPRRECLFKYIVTASRGEIDPAAWWRDRQHGGEPPLSIAQAVDLVSLSSEKSIRTAVKRGDIRALALPKDIHGRQDLRLLASDIRAYRRRTEREMSGGDYHRRYDDFLE